MKITDGQLAAMSLEQLMELNKKVVRHIKLASAVANDQAMREFTTGERVCFTTPEFGLQYATIEKFNRKTISVITDDGEGWNVSPQRLSKVKDIDNVIDMRDLG